MLSKHSIVRLEVARKNAFSPSKIFDFENVNFQEFQNENFSIRIFFYGALNLEISEESVIIGSLEDLQSRGLLIKIDRNEVSIKNDWLGSIPIFFNRESKCISTDYKFCVNNPEIDSLGLENYLLYGYSVFGLTPIKRVEFLEYCSEISINENEIKIWQQEDPILKCISCENSSVEEVIGKISKKILDNTKSKDQIVIPLSAGYDSRLLTMLAHENIEPEKIHNVSYGYSKNQYKSYEVEIARRVSSGLGTHFDWIELGNENHYISQWLELKGSATHLHGMYQIDFYNKIVPNLKNKAINISGIYGDLWSGKIKTNSPKSPKEYEQLFLPHGLNYSAEIPEFTNSRRCLEERFYRDREFLDSEYFRLVTIARHKVMLLSYLIDVPQNLGLETFSPFLDFDIVSSILRLPKNIWENRKWQVDLFKQRDLFFNLPITIESRSNMLFINSYRNFEFPPISASFFPYEFKKRIAELNYILHKKSKRILFIQYLITRYKLKKMPFLGSIIKQTLRDAIYDYYHLAPLESILNEIK